MTSRSPSRKEPPTCGWERPCSGPAGLPDAQAHARIAILFSQGVFRSRFVAAPKEIQLMAITPLEIQKMRFTQKMRGYDSTEVEGFLSLVAEDLAGRLTQIEKLERENHLFKQRLEET